MSSKQSLPAIVTAGLSGILFGLGLAISGMTNPVVVLGFLDLFGAWNPSLIFVMAAALVVTFIGYRLIFRGAAPFFGEKFDLPTKQDIDARLIIGAVLFGIGWGLYGYCPGPAIASILSLDVNVFAFVVAMVAGGYATRFVTKE